MKINLFCYTLIALSLTSCATIFSGGNRDIIIYGGDQNKSVTIVTDEKVYKDVTLPYVVRAAKHKLEGQRISVTTKDGKYPDIILYKRANYKSFGNIIIGGLIGLGIDLFTNNSVIPVQKKFYLDPKYWRSNGTKIEETPKSEMKINDLFSTQEYK
ncbi:MAG: hypothetical protein K6E54_06490 [Bacteroidaceae bacterium]|nr:hypothetical protein [Bacteroidaceae bacterium]